MTSFIHLFMNHSLRKCGVLRTRSLKPTRARTVCSNVNNICKNIIIYCTWNRLSQETGSGVKTGSGVITGSEVKTGSGVKWNCEIYYCRFSTLISWLCSGFSFRLNTCLLPLMREHICKHLHQNIIHIPNFL